MATKPLIILNFKIYPESAGCQALSLVGKISKIHSKKYQIILAPSVVMMKTVLEKTKLPVFSQHADPVSLGPYTGRIPIEELKAVGIKGTLINHSERKVPLPLIDRVIELAKSKQKSEIFTVVACASSLTEIRRIAFLKPPYIAYEPLELIGGEVSVSEVHPTIISTAVKLVESISPHTKLLCGAGIVKKEDLIKALELGAKGVLMGHAVPTAKDPVKFLQELLK